MPTVCPSREELAAFQSGRLAGAALDQVARHLEGCPPCQTALQNADTVSDAILRGLKEARASDTFTDESDCRRAVARIEGIANKGTTQTRDDTTCDGAPAPGLTPTTLGKYQLFEQIGQGGMGTVYRAAHLLLKRTVAIKMLPPNRLKDPQAVSRFRREIEAAGRLKHANIVHTSDADEADGQHFLVMEWLLGQDLSRYVSARGPLPVAQACDFIRQAALGLQCAHEHGMVHRDVKPSNLMLVQDPEPTIKVLDLGLALLHDEHVKAGAELTSDGQVMGTFDFIAPEQAMESHTVDHRADIYSLGCTFYYLLTGRTPFQAKSAAKKLLAHQTEQPAPLDRTDVPREVLAVLRKMMAKDPDQRYATMSAVAASLAGATRTYLSTTESARPAPSRRRPVLIAAALLVGLAAIVGALALVVYASGIIRVTVPEGDFVIKTDDPNISFSVNKGTVHLVDKKTDRTYQVKAVRKPNGAYELDVHDVAADLKFKTDQLIIRRGEDVVLTGRFERKNAAIAKVDPGPAMEPKKDTVEPKTNLDKILASPPEKKTQPGVGPIDTNAVMLKFTTKLGVAGELKLDELGFDESSRNLYLRDQYGFAVKVLAKDADPIDPNAEKSAKMRIAIDQGNSVYLFVPIRQVQRIDAAGKDHLVTLTDGTKLQGRMMSSAHGNKRTIHLGDFKEVEVVAGAPIMPAETKGAKYLLKLPAPLGLEYRLPAYHVSSGGYNFGQRVKLTVDGDTLTPELSDFDKITVAAADAKWEMRLTTPGGKETAGTWEIAHPSSSVRRWILIGATRNDWHVMVVYLNANSSGFTLEKIQGAPANAKPANEVGEIRRYLGHRMEVRCVSWAPDGKSFVSGSFGEPWLWDVDSTVERRRLARIQGWVHGGAISHDGAFVVAGGQGGVAALWDAKTGKKLHDITKFAIGGPVENVVCAPDEPIVYYSNAGGVRVFDLARKQDAPRRFQGERISLSRDGKRLLSCQGKTLYLWDAHTGKELATAEHPPVIACIALAPDGRHAAVSTGKVVTIWDVEAKKMGKRLEGPARVQAIAISPAGTRALTGGADGKLRLWNLESGAQLHCFEGHTGPILTVAFAPDGARALSGSEDKSIRLWQLPNEPRP